MAKKKAIKLATATAIAATAFVAAAPGQSEAATNSVDKAISNAKSKMLKAFNTYNKTARVEGKLPALSTIKKDVAAAKEAYAAAQKEISKNGGTKAKKAAYTKTLDANKQYLDRAELYLKAVTTNLKPSKEAFEKAVTSGKQYNVMTTQEAYKAKIAEFEAAVAKVYGPDARNLLTAKYADSANKLANSVNDEMAVYKAYRSIEQEGLLAKDLKAAYEKIESVKAQAATIAKLDSKLAKNITAAVEKNNGKFETAVKESITTDLKNQTTEEDTITFSVKAPEGAEVQVIQNTDNDIKANADGTYTVKLVEGKNNIDIRTTTYGVKTENFFEVVSNQTPEVKSVSAINLKEVVVNFSQKVDKTTAETVGNFTLKKGTSPLAIASSKVQADGKSVLLTLDSNAAQQDAVELEVKNVKGENGKVVKTTTKEFTFFDAVAPTTEDVRVIGPRKVEVTFSEPLQNAPTVKLDNGSISSTVTLNTADRTKAIVEFGIEPTLASHSLEIEGGTDYAGFKVAKVTKEFSYSKDEVAPTAIIDKVEPNRVTLKFSKPVAVKSVANVSLYHTVNNSGAYVGTNLTAVNTVGGYADTYTVDFTTPLAEGSSKVFLNTAANALEDEWGNDVASTELTASVVIDKVAPQVTNVVASTDKKLEVTFSKEVDESDAETKANYVLTDADGKAVSILAGTFAYDNTKKKTTITLPSNLKAGNYSLTVKDIKDTTYAANKLTSQTVTVAVPDATPWNISGKAIKNGNNIRITFDEAMSAEGLTSLANYSLRAADGSAIAFPENTKIVALNSTTVEIRLGSDKDVETIRVAGSLKDAAGNVYSNTDYRTVTVEDDTLTEKSIVEDSATTKTKNTLQFQLDQELQGSLKPADFTLEDGKEIAGASYVNNSGKSTVTLTLKANQEFDADAKPVLNVTAKALKNTFGTESAEFTSVEVADGIAPSVAALEKGLNIIDDAKTDVTDFVITFNEDLGAESQLWAGDLVIRDADGELLKAGDDYTISAEDEELTVTLEDEYAGILTVSSVSKPAYIRDVAGNAANAFSTTTVTVSNTEKEAEATKTAEAEVASAKGKVKESYEVAKLAEGEYTAQTKAAAVKALVEKDVDTSKVSVSVADVVSAEDGKVSAVVTLTSKNVDTVNDTKTVAVTVAP